MTLINNSESTLTESQNGYFPSDSNYNQSEFKSKLKRWWDTFQYRARQVWPWVYRLINFVVYEIIKVLKAIVKIAMQQIGLMKGE